MRILHLHEAVTIHGGAEVYISQLQQLLPEYGHASFWIAFFETKDGHNLASADEQISGEGSKQEMIELLAAFVEHKQIDIINIHSIFDESLIRWCLSARPVIKFSHSPIMVCPGRDKFWRHSERICNIKYGMHCFRHIYTEGCANRDPRKVLKSWMGVRFELKFAADRYQRIVVMSDYIKNGLIECGVPGNRIALNPYFTQMGGQMPMPPDDFIEKRVLFVGRLSASKGVHIMLEAMSGLLRTLDEVYLDIVGDGRMRDSLEQQVQRYKLGDKVVFHGWKGREVVEKMIKASYIVAFPSIYPEAFGIVGIEAMMCSKPVVAFDVGGVSTWLEHERTGFLVRRGDEQGMRTAIEQLLADHDLYRRMSAEAYRQATERFIPEVHMQSLLSLYENCLT